jgi:hypothetical protein
MFRQVFALVALLLLVCVSANVNVNVDVHVAHPQSHHQQEHNREAVKPHHIVHPAEAEMDTINDEADGGEEETPETIAAIQAGAVEQPSVSTGPLHYPKPAITWTASPNFDTRRGSKIKAITLHGKLYFYQMRFISFPNSLSLSY